MVVCKCRKATKLYCFVHKVPVCGECICFPEHQICVVRTYSEWVIDGEYDWPPSCCKCNAVLEEGTDPETTRLGCLHVIHTNCLISHIKSFPSHTAPAGYVCPTCPTPLWPPKNFKDSGSRLHSKLKDAVVQTNLEKNVFGSHQVSMASPERGPPTSFSSDSLKRLSGTGSAEGMKNETSGATDNIVEIGGSPASSLSLNHIKAGSPSAGTATRKGALNVERQNSEISYFADDEDGNRKKYTRRGSFRHKIMRALLPFWSSALPTLPVTAPTRRDSLNADDGTEGRGRHKRSSRMDPRKILLFIAIMACMVTMGILYYRLAQGTLGLGQEVSYDER